MKHTPGPWSDGRQVSIFHQDGAGLNLGYLVTSDPLRMGEGQANAHLIAAAPDLLEALEDSESFVQFIIDTRCDSPTSNSVLRIIQAAIAKAKGETK